MIKHTISILRSLDICVTPAFVCDADLVLQRRRAHTTVLRLYIRVYAPAFAGIGKISLVDDSVTGTREHSGRWDRNVGV